MAKSVIVIDDDQDDIDLLTEAINQFDKSLACISFNSPEKALLFLSGELILMPDYIFIDINMPGITGDKVLNEVRKNSDFDRVIVAMISTTMSKNVSESLKKLGANFTFQKPDKFEVFHSILRKILIN
jgi:CheY-like chemotaxis protein